MIVLEIARRFGTPRQAGNQIQTITLEQSGGAPTNRIQSVEPGIPVNTNVALASNGATASASSTYSNDYPASAVTNGDRKGLNWENGGGWMDATDYTYPDWVQVNFNGSKTINEIDVFTLQDNYENPAEPTEAMTFSLYGIVDFQVQYWNGSSWQTVSGGNVTGNNKVWRKFTFSEVTTDKVRVNITSSQDSKGRSKVVEIEAWGMVTGPSSYSYDAAGNVINDGVHTYGYDSENRVVSVDGGSTASYAYDQSNQRYQKGTGGLTTHYIWQDSHVIAEYNGSNGALLTDYIYSGDRMVAKVESGTTSYFLCDPLGVRLTLDAGGNLVGRQGRLAFGEDFAETGIQEKHHFTTYERDAETGSDYAVNRTHSPNIGRFQQCDPYKGRCDSSDPQKLNRYSYVENDPINKVDPLGLMSTSEFICIIAPILCEINTLPGGGPRPNPDGYSGWRMGFGFGVIGGTRCKCSGTTDCGFYKKMCKAAAGKTDAAFAYYCVAAPAVCRATKLLPDKCTMDCIRLSLQELDVEADCINSPDNATFNDCQIRIHTIAFLICGKNCH